MNKKLKQLIAIGACTIAAAATVPAHSEQPLAANRSGAAATISTAGRLDRTNPFFQSLGSNGRSCASCHVQHEGWSVTPEGLRARFRATGGTDPVFRANDGATSPLADVSTLRAREKAYSMLLSKGLFRVGIGMPANAEFELAQVEDPYGFASAKELSLFRRPLPSTNLRFISAVMWDGRETFQDPSSPLCIAATSSCFATIPFDLLDQANSAVLGHAQAGVPLTDLQRQQIVDFEFGLYTAQAYDARAGWLHAGGGHGGPLQLSQQTSYFGINDTLAGDYRTGASFNPQVMELYGPWGGYLPTERVATPAQVPKEMAAARASIARGEAIFNSKPISISGVRGLNDALKIPVLQGTCTTCHNTPNAGSHSVPFPLDIGLTDASRRTPDLPLYTLRNKLTGQVIQTTDPGRAMVTGKWQDVARFKGPVLRALAARAPYFHNGSAKSLEEAVHFYNQRFGIGFTDQESKDLAAFLAAL